MLSTRFGTWPTVLVPDPIPLSDAPCVHLFLADDAKRLLIVFNYNLMYVWEASPGGSTPSRKQTQLQGTWSQVLPDANVTVPDASYREAGIHAMFFVDKVCRTL